MSETHTPGPWTAWDRGIGWEVHHSFDPEMGHGNAVNDEFRDTFKEADARLIAAAPDLLSIAERWTALDGGAWDIQRHSRDKAELLAETRAVIQKAKESR